MAQAFNYFDDWLKTQNSVLATWAENTKKLQEDFHASCKGGEGPSRILLDQYLNIYKAWVSATSRAVQGEGADPLQDAAVRAAESRNVYAKVFDMWMPMWQAIQEKATDASCYECLIDPVKLQGLIDRAFGFSPQSIGAFFEQTEKNLDTSASSSRKFFEPWSQALQKNSSLMPLAMQGQPESFLAIFHNNYDAFDNTFGRVFHIPPVGKDRMKIRLFQKGFDDIAVFMAKYIEYMHVMYVTGLRAFEKLIKAAAAKVKSNELNSFDQIFQLWIEINEKEYLELGRTSDFSKLQGELMNSGLNVRRHYFKLVELYLYDFPVPVRSEMDDLYKTIYEMKKKIKSLESRIRNFTGEEVAA